MLLRSLRLITGLFIVATMLYAATLAVRDCAAGPYLSENCLWLAVRERLHLPQSKLLRSLTLELVGLVLAAAIYLAIRYLVLLRPRSGQRARNSVDQV